MRARGTPQSFLLWYYFCSHRARNGAHGWYSSQRLGHAFRNRNCSIPVLASVNVTLKSWQWKAALLILPARSIQTSHVNLPNVFYIYIYAWLLFISHLSCSIWGFSNFILWPRLGRVVCISLPCTPYWPPWRECFILFWQQLCAFQQRRQPFVKALTGLKNQSPAPNPPREVFIRLFSSGVEYNSLM